MHCTLVALYNKTLLSPRLHYFVWFSPALHWIKWDFSTVCTGVSGWSGTYTVLLLPASCNWIRGQLHCFKSPVRKGTCWMASQKRDHLNGQSSPHHVIGSGVSCIAWNHLLKRDQLIGFSKKGPVKWAILPTSCNWIRAQGSVVLLETTC